MRETSYLFCQKAKDVSLLVKVREVADANIEHLTRVLLQLGLDVELGWHYVFMHDCLSLEVIVFHVRLIIFFAVIVVFVTILFIESVIFEVIPMSCLVCKGRRMLIKPFIVVLPTYCVIPILVEIVSQRVVEALVCQNVEAIGIKSAVSQSLDLFLRQFDAKNASAVFVVSVCANEFFRSNVST
jgi:hypothetical protein